MQHVDPDLLALMEMNTPKFNEKVVQGYAQDESENFIPYIDGLLTLWSKSLQAAGTGISYAGWQHVTPYERLQEETRPMSSKRTYEIARSDYSMIRINLKLNGQPLKTRYLKVAFFGNGGTFKLRGSKYQAVPTLVDHLFSIEDGSIFMPVTRARPTFNREPYFYLADGAMESADYYWAKLHHSRRNEAPKSRHPQIINYIFAQYGLTETFKRYFNAEVHFGDIDTINDVDFPEDQWVICSSSGNRPRGRITAGPYEVPTLRLAVARDAYDNRVLKSAIASVFYITDLCSQQPFFDYSDFDDPFLWRRTLSRFIWKSIDERDAIAHVDEHLDSISEYIDDFVIRKLKHQNIEVREINELFFFIMSNFSDMTIKNDVSSTRTKKLSVVEEVLFPIRSMIFNLMFSLMRVPKERLKPENIDRILDRDWKALAMMSIASGKHPEIQVLESTTDQKAYKIGRVVHIPSKNGSKSKSAEMYDPAFKLNPDMIETCSWLFITKSSPSGRGSLSPFTQTDAQGCFIFNPEFQKYHQNLHDLS